MRDDDCVNDLLHTVHVNAVYPVCILMCVVRLDESANDLVHIVHENGFSPV